MKPNHLPEISNVQKEFDSHVEWLQKSKWGKSSIDVYISGMAIRATETIESMLVNASGAPDNTLTILFRNVFETVVRIRYLAQNPEKRICEFHLADIRGRLGVIGENDGKNDGPKDIAHRADLVSKREIYKEKVKALHKTKKPISLSVERMCEAIGEKDNYAIYRILSQYEHSNGAGLVGSVVDVSSEGLVYNQDMEKEQAQLMWKAVRSQLAGIKEAVDTLNSHRPDNKS